MDSVDEAHFLRQLRAVDGQLFDGFRGSEALLDESTLRALANAAVAAQSCLARGGRVVMLGCGTSGRICHLIADLHRNNNSGNNNVIGRVAGGEASLVLSNELPEDDPLAGAAAYVEALGDAPVAMCVGVTCGLSADFVGTYGGVCLVSSMRPTHNFAHAGGALQCAMRRGDATLLVGFNNSSLARTPLMQSVVTAMTSSRAAHIVTPIVGPEALAGSSRMKGGSATLMLLDALLYAAASSSDAVLSTTTTTETTTTMMMARLGARLSSHRADVCATHAINVGAQSSSSSSSSSSSLLDALRAITRTFASRASSARVALVADCDEVVF